MSKILRLAALLLAAMALLTGGFAAVVALRTGVVGDGLSEAAAKILQVAHAVAAQLGALPLPAAGSVAVLSTVAVALGTVVYLVRSRSRQREAAAVATAAGDQPSWAVPPGGAGAKSDLSAALARCRSAFIGIAVFSALINTLALTGSIFMLEVYDRVLPSRSVPTLVGLAVLTALLLGCQGLLDLIRTRILARVGTSLDNAVSRRVYASMVLLPLRSPNQGDGMQPLRDLDNVRSFLSSLGPTALFDLPWMPIYLGVIFAFHPLLGYVALTGAAFLVLLTLLTEVLTRRSVRTAGTFAVPRHGMAEAGVRNAEALAAMGMTRRLADHWGKANDSYLDNQRAASDVTGGFGAVSKVMRLLLQSGVLAVGAYLVIHQEATAGIIIAASILTARAFAPVDLAIAHWKGFSSARQGWKRLANLLQANPVDLSRLPLPAPKAELSVDAIIVAPPGAARAVVTDVSFRLSGGQGLGIIGPSAAGKSSLARVLVGIWQPARGKVRLDGAALDQWEPEALGRHVGYLPQDVELLAGTVAQNIARFDPAAPAEAVIEAARVTGAHDFIIGLPQGYDTKLAGHHLGLSAGQQQRIALARALYGDPFLVVLDEPNSNLDGEGEAALTEAIVRVRKRGGIVVVIAHRPSALAGVDMVLVLANGRAQSFGPKESILSNVQRSQFHVPPPLRIVSEASEKA
jgi:PrtD family type I secretion system ABC transporter